MVPVCTTCTLATTVNWPAPARFGKLQVIVPPRVPGAGPAHAPTLAGFKVTESNFKLPGMVFLKPTFGACTFWEFFTCHVYVSGAPVGSVPVTVGPPFAADPVIWISVAGAGGAGGVRVKVPNAATGRLWISEPENAALSVATFALIVAVTLMVAVASGASVPKPQVTVKPPGPVAEQLP